MSTDISSQFLRNEAIELRRRFSDGYDTNINGSDWSYWCFFCGDDSGTQCNLKAIPMADTSIKITADCLGENKYIPYKTSQSYMVKSKSTPFANR